MAVSPQQSISARLKEFNRLSGGQQIGLMLVLATVVALISGAWMWSQTPDYRVLYSNLSDRDGGAIINSLQQMNVPYKMAEGGGAILVASNQVYEVRLRLASQGLPKGSVVGFELMENQKLGTSQFLEQVNYQRALEGELTRSIQSLSAVQGARVHLAIPRPSVFTREQQKPSASVLVSLYPGRLLDRAQVSGIVHLVSSSVPDLPIKNITVLDQTGNLLSAADDGSANAGLDPGQLEYLHQVEQSFIKRIENILSPITGTENVRAQVAAELDFSQTEQTAETFRPNSTPTEAAIRSQQSNETSGGGQAASGVPGALSNQPPGAASAPLTAPATAAAGAAPAQPVGGGSGSKESTVNYELDKTIKHVKSPVGSIKRLSVAVVVNYKKIVDKDGKVSVKPMAAAEMAQISNLVKEAMGYRQERGDTLNVVNASFSAAAEEIPTATPIWKDPATISLARDIAKNLLIAGIVFFLVFKVLRPLFKELSTPPLPPKVEEAEQVEHLGMPLGAMKADYEDRLRVAKVMAREEPKVVASVVKDWIGSNE
ncbi:MAG TPA: flagellar basal-body MS-ring/collar protein FliF [Sulfuricella sp.]|nr:flagellar basal-body MS-ring/collar protein FliF [Sulfuricella sp.]